MIGLARGAPRPASIFELASPDIAEDAAGYGYWAVLLVVAGDGVFPVLPGETAIVAAAVLAADGSLSLPLVILAGAVGRDASATRRAYWIGRAGGGPIKRTVTRFAGRGAPDGGRADGAAPGRGAGVRGPLPARHPHRDQPLVRRRPDGVPALPRSSTRSAALVWATQAALLGYFAGKAFADQLWVAFVVAFGGHRLVGGFVALKERKRVREGARRGGGGAQDAGPAPATPGAA